MTRETKLGIGVASSFLALVGTVLGVKLQQGEPPAADAPAVAAAPEAKPAAEQPQVRDVSDAAKQDAQRAPLPAPGPAPQTAVQQPEPAVVTAAATPPAPVPVITPPPPPVAKPADPPPLNPGVGAAAVPTVTVVPAAGVPTLRGSPSATLGPPGAFGQRPRDAFVAAPRPAPPPQPKAQ